MKVFLVILIFMASYDIRGGVGIDLRLEVSDIIAGEGAYGGFRMMNLVIENKGKDLVKLGGGWGKVLQIKKPCWEVEIEGPIDNWCYEYYYKSEGAEETGIGEEPGLEIKSGEVLKFELPLPGVANIGEYKVWVEYDGEKARCKNCYKGKLRSEERTFRIKEPEGIDKEIYDLWKKQNPKTPVCQFPINMKPDITKPSILLENYPTSTYAGWVLLSNGPNASWAFYKGKYINEKKEYIKNVKIFIDAKPDFLFSGALASSAGSVALGIDDYSSACYLYKKAVELKWEVPALNKEEQENLKMKAKDKLKELNEKGICK